MNKTKNIVLSLQSIRGLAAVCVMLLHCSYPYPISVGARALIDAILNAHAAVIIFFVLSGYVLTGSLVKNGCSLYSIFQYAMRRVFRIYPCLIASIILVFVVSKLYTSGDIELNLTDWHVRHVENVLAQNAFKLNNVVKSLVPISFRLLPQSWTLFVELVGSALLPIFVLASRYSVRLSIGILTSVIVVGALTTESSVIVLRYSQYVGCFLLGSVLLLHQNKLKGRLFFSTKFGIFGSILLIFSRYLVHSMEEGPYVNILYGYGDFTLTIIETLGALILINAASQRSNLRSLLENRILVWLGEISFGIYLVHLPVLMLIIPLTASLGLSATINVIFTIILVSVLSLVLSTFLYVAVERPFIRLSWRLFHTRREQVNG